MTLEELIEEVHMHIDSQQNDEKIQWYHTDRDRTKEVLNDFLIDILDKHDSEMIKLKRNVVVAEGFVTEANKKLEEYRQKIITLRKI